MLKTIRLSSKVEFFFSKFFSNVIFFIIIIITIIIIIITIDSLFLVDKLEYIIHIIQKIENNKIAKNKRLIYGNYPIT